MAFSIVTVIKQNCKALKQRNGIVPSTSVRLAGFVVRLAVLNKVSGLKLYSKVCVANKPPNPKIFPHSKFHPNQTTGLRFMAKKYNF